MEVKVLLSLLVQGANLLTPEFCEKNPKESYDTCRIPIEVIKGKGKRQKKVKEILIVKTRKQRLVKQSINICKEAFDYMLETPAKQKLIKVWKTLSMHDKLKAHFDLIAEDFRAVSYSYEILDD